MKAHSQSLCCRPTSHTHSSPSLVTDEPGGSGAWRTRRFKSPF